jgi:TatD DNase family protein
MFYNLHTHHKERDADVVALVNQYPLEFDDAVPMYSIGIHPWKIDESTVEKELSVIKDKLSDPKCLAVGECGLDKRIETPIEMQLPVFRRQLRLAQDSEKPVVLHCVAAYQEAIRIKSELKITVPMVIHGFSKSAQIAGELLRAGFYLSFGKYLLRNPELSDVFASVPAERYFLETDMIEESIFQVYDKAAEARNVSVEEIKKQVEANWKSVFPTKN